MKKIVALSLISAALLMAADEDKKTSGFVTHTELSYVRTQGNTDTTAFAIDFTGTQTISDVAIKLDADALYGDEDSIENKNKWLTELNLDYKFAKYFTVNYLTGYKEDKFSGYTYQFYTGPGVKYIALDSKSQALDFQVNGLYSEDSDMQKYYTDSNKTDEIAYPYVGGIGGTYLDPESGKTEDYIGYVAKVNYSWTINESLKFRQEASYRGDVEDMDKYFVYSKTAFESKIADLLSFGISYKVDYTNTPPAEKVYTDTTFMTSLIIDY